MINPVGLEHPRDRFLAVVKYYLNSIYPARKSKIAKKPYNPVIGEIFRCRWNVPGLELEHQKTIDGLFPMSDFNQVIFLKILSYETFY